MSRLRATDIKFLKGVGPKRGELLAKELGIATCHDLLYHFPSHYVDRTTVYKISSFSGEMPMVQVKGVFVNFNVQGEGAKTRLIGLFSDGERTMDVVWFRRIREIKSAYRVGNEYVLFGKPAEFNGHWSMVHPEVDSVASAAASTGLRGVYPLTENSGSGVSAPAHCFSTIKLF